MHYTQKDPYRKTKPVRDIEAVLQKEEDLQRLEEMGNAKAVAAEAAADVRTGSKMMHVTPGQLALPVEIPDMDFGTSDDDAWNLDDVLQMS
ncbi:hypothetical protein ABBQ32_000722 [Trebouxia sp. C0010 RCD-2024]